MSEHVISPEKRMRTPERLARLFGGYALSFARFNAGIIPTYIGASLLGGAIFGGTGLKAAGRVIEGGVGFGIMRFGDHIERSMHTGVPLFNNSAEQSLPAHTEAVNVEAPAYPIQGLNQTGLWSRVITAWQTLRGHTPQLTPVPIPAMAVA